MNENKIVLTVHLKQLQRETGMSAEYIVSQIIIQGFDLVEIKEDNK